MTASPTEQRASRRRIDVLRLGAVAVAGAVLAVSAVVALGAYPGPTTGQPGASPVASAGPTRQDDGARFKLPRGFAGLLGLLGFGNARGGPGNASGAARAPITITAIHGTSIDLRTDDGWTRTISVTADTRISKNGQTATVADLKVGDRIVLRQRRDDDGSYAIVAITVPVPLVAGTVTAVGADSLTLKTRDGATRTVTLTGTTTYQLGRADGKKADLKVGAVVVVAGTEGPGSAFTATSVRIQVRSSRVAGEVTAKTKDALTVKQRDGTSITVRIGPATRFDVRGVASPSLADVAVGMKVVAVGTLAADGSLSATVIAAGKAGPSPTPTSGGTQG